MTESENTPVNASELNAKIIKQIEYYFGNINLPRDKFLQEKIKLDDGWVAIETLLTFNRLAQLSKDVAVIAEAIKGADSEVVSLSEDGLKIRRNIGNPLPENSLEYWQKIKHVTVFMKGFPTDSTLDNIMEYAKKFGNVENVLMRRNKDDRQFKGSAFVTYKTREEAESALNVEEKFGEIELVKMMQNDYWTMKNKEAKETRAMEKMAKSSKKANEEVEKANITAHFVKGLILSLDGVSEESSVNGLKDFFRQFGDVAYVVYNKGETTAEIRFSGEENGAVKAMEKAKEAGEGKIVFEEKELTAKILEGEEEEKYWNEFNTSIQNKRNNRNSGRGGGRGGRGRGGRGRGGGRDRGQKRTGGNDGPVAKKIVYDDDGNPSEVAPAKPAETAKPTETAAAE